MSRRLVLFDIDGTLLLARGVSAFVEAGKHVFGEDFSIEGLPLGGQLDPSILYAALERLGMEPHEVNLQAFRSPYATFLERVFASGDRVAETLPGVTELVEALVGCEDIDLGLLTGNIEETGRMKVAAAGLDLTHFTVHAWGDEGALREHLPHVALERWRTQRRILRDFEHAIIIGDTVHDVHCGKVNGCRVLAVCTGSGHRAELEAAGADRVVEDLTQTDDLVDWLRR